MAVKTLALFLCILVGYASGYSSTCWKPYPENSTHLIASLLTINEYDTPLNETTGFNPAEAQLAFASAWAVDRLNERRTLDEQQKGVLYGSVVCNAKGTEDSIAAARLVLADNSGSTILGFLDSNNIETAKELGRALPQQVLPVISQGIPREDDTQLPPNLFTTMPTVEQFMQRTKDAILEMDWTYFLVIYTDDDFGKYAADVLRQKLAPLSSRVCISRSLSLNMRETNPEQFRRVWQELRDLQAKTRSKKGENMEVGAVLITNELTGGDLFQSLISRVEATNSENVHWIVPFGVGRSFRTNLKNFRDMVAFSPQSKANGFYDGNMATGISTLVSYIGGKDAMLKSVFGSLMVEQYKQLPGVDQSNTLRPYLTALLNLIAASRKCSQDNSCNLLQNLHNGTQLGRNIGSELSTFFQGIQTGFSDDNRLVNSQQLDTFRYVYDQRSVQRQLFSSKLEQNSLLCNGACGECIDNTTLSFIHIPGDYYIISVFPVHNSNPSDPWTCGKMNDRELRDTTGFLLSEAFLYALRIVNRNVPQIVTDHDPKLIEQQNQFSNINFTIGAVLIDDCSQAQRVNSLLTSFLRGDLPQYYGFPDVSKIMGIVGSFSSDQSIAIASLAARLNITVVSYGSTAISLNDRLKYPTFLRTVPPDSYQVEGMVALLLQNKWTYVSTLNSKNEYGRSGIDRFITLARQRGICIGLSQEIDEQTDGKHLIQAYRNYSDARVILYFGDEHLVKTISSGLEKEREFVIVGSEAWANRMGMIEGNSGKLLEGSYTFMINAGSENNFGMYINNKQLSANLENPWFVEYWEEQNDCNSYRRFPKGKRHITECPQTSSLFPVNEPFRVPLINAVLALVKGVASAAGVICGYPLNSLCDQFRTREDVVYESVRSVNFTVDATGSPSDQLFDSTGNGISPYIISVIRRVGDNLAYEHLYNYLPSTKKLERESTSQYQPVTVDSQCRKPECKKICSAQIPSSPDQDSCQEQTLLIALMVVSAIAAILLVAVIGLVVKFMFNGNQTNKSKTSKYVDAHSLYFTCGDKIPMDIMSNQTYPDKNRSSTVTEFDEINFEADRYYEIERPSYSEKAYAVVPPPLPLRPMATL